MSLQGRLEDLGICSILQLISLGKKSGTLTLEQGGERGGISFCNGQVVRASSSRFPQGLGELLVNRQLVTRQQVDEALQFQQKLQQHQPLGKILTHLFRIASAAIEQVVTAQIERIVIDFCGWSKGDFSFSLEPVATYGSALLNPLDLMLEKGLSPSRLALKGQLADASAPHGVPSDDMLEKKLQEMEQRQSQGRVDLLRAMLAELQQPDLGGGIILLILRYASELMPRAVIFDVRGSRLVGLGQFGLTDCGVVADRMIRQLDLEISSDSLFFQALKKKTLIRGRLGRSESEKRLRAALKGEPESVLIAPLISAGRVVALLYGDGFQQSLSPLAFDAFAIFLAQAGITMEQALQLSAEV